MTYKIRDNKRCYFYGWRTPLGKERQEAVFTPSPAMGRVFDQKQLALDFADHLRRDGFSVSVVEEPRIKGRILGIKVR